jgi:hypothetical protein
VIHLFANGGPSHLDTFDPKPVLAKYAGREIPNNLPTERRTGAALPSPFAFARHGASGLEVSELFPSVARHADRLLVVRSMHADVPNHEPSLMLMNCGDARLVRPAAGAWVTYGLGTENQNLPGFVAMCPGGYPIKGTENWRSAFLPGAFQGTYVDTRKQKIDDLVQYVRHPLLDRDTQGRQVDLTTRLDRRHLEARQHDPLLEARLESLELAWRMQAEAGEAFDVSREPAHVLARYGDGVQGRQMLIARRLVERGSPGTATKRSKKTTAGWPTNVTVPSAPCSTTWWGWACWRARWSCGGASSAARPPWNCPWWAPVSASRRAATTTITASRCGWPAAA